MNTTQPTKGDTMNTTEHAAQIRKTLKTVHGWNSKQVSVRSEYFSMGSSITVKINDPAIPLAIVQAVAEVAESIRRCEYSGEILSGGNRYLHVSYSVDALKVLAAKVQPAVEAAVAQVEPGSSVLMPIEGTPYLVGRRNQWAITVWQDGFLFEANTAECVAAQIGTRMVAA